MVMQTQTDILEVLFGDNVGDKYLRSDREINFYIPQTRVDVGDQQLDMSEIIEGTDDYFSDIPDMDNFLESDECVPYVDGTVVEISSSPAISPEVPTTSTSEQMVLVEDPSQNYFQFPSTSFVSELQDMDNTDTESYFSCTVPSTPFSPTSPYSLAPPTPDTASSSMSSSSATSSFLKASIKQSIQSKRRREGKGELKVEFVPAPEEKLTEEEEERRIEKREKNKLAAQKCRAKKNTQADILEEETKRLEKKQAAFKTEIQKLLEERDHLMDIVQIHSSVCPKLRATSASF